MHGIRDLRRPPPRTPRQPHISELRNYKLSRFSSERLLHFITRLDKDVAIVIRPKAAGHAAGLVSVLVAA